MPFDVGGQILTNLQLKHLNERGIIRDSIVFYIDAAITDSYPGSGFVLTDISGGTFSGTMSNGATYSSFGGGCIQFAVNCVDFGYNSYDIGLRRNATYMGWVYPLDNASSYIISDWNGTGMTLRTNNNTSADFYVYPNNHRITYAYNFTASVWYHLTGVMNGADMYMYLNGMIVGSQSLGEDIGSSPSTLKMSSRGDGIGSNSSRVANVIVYNRTLTGPEILQNYNAHRSRFGV